jgi:hypothetical protein
MKYLALAVGAFGVMVYALLHSSLTTEQATIIIGLSFMSTIGAFMFVCGIMSDRLRRHRANLEALSKESDKRIAILKDLQEKAKAD